MLLAAAFLIALPWIGCTVNPVTHAIDLFFVRTCTFGLGIPLEPRSGLAGFNGYWGNLVLGVAYVTAALFVMRTKRSL